MHILLGGGRMVKFSLGFYVCGNNSLPNSQRSYRAWWDR